MKLAWYKKWRVASDDQMQAFYGLFNILITNNKDFY